MYGDYAPLKDIQYLMEKYGNFHFYVDDAPVRVEVILCKPICGPTSEGALSTVSIAPNQSVQITLRITPLYTKLDSGRSRVAYGLVIAPSRAQMELNSSDNAQIFEVDVGPFVDGFE